MRNYSINVLLCFIHFRGNPFFSKKIAFSIICFHSFKFECYIREIKLNVSVFRNAHYGIKNKNIDKASQ